MNWAQWILVGWFSLLLAINAGSRGYDSEWHRWGNITLGCALIWLVSQT